MGHRRDRERARAGVVFRNGSLVPASLSSEPSARPASRQKYEELAHKIGLVLPSESGGIIVMRSRK